MTELLANISNLGIQLNGQYYTAEQQQRQWIGFEGCTEEDIQRVETRLHLSLPHDYRELMKQSNGFADANGIEPTFCPIDRVDYLHNVDPDLAEAWLEAGNTELGEKLKTAIQIGGFEEEQQFFLIPPGDSHPNWEYVKFAYWIPGDESHPSLRSYFERVLQTTQNLLEKR